MEKSNIIRTLRDVYNVAEQVLGKGRVYVQKLEETHAKGAMGVRMIVGQKRNDAYSIDADPNKIGLTKEEKVVAEFRSKLEVPDIRILWITPGTTVEELVSEFLQGIKDSLDKKPVTIDPGITTMNKKSEVSDVEIAAAIARGDKVGFEISAEDEEEEIGFGGESSDEEDNDELEEEEEEEGGPQRENTDESDKDAPSWAKQIIKNQETLAGDLGELNQQIGNIELRVNNMENKKSPTKGKKKK